MDRTHFVVPEIGIRESMRIVPYGAHIRLTIRAYIKMLGYYPKGILIKSYKSKEEDLGISGLQYIVREIAKRSGLTLYYQAVMNLKRATIPEFTNIRQLFMSACYHTF